MTNFTIEELTDLQRRGTFLGIKQHGFSFILSFVPGTFQHHSLIIVRVAVLCHRVPSLLDINVAHTHRLERLDELTTGPYQFACVEEKVISTLGPRCN